MTVKDVQQEQTTKPVTLVSFGKLLVLLEHLQRLLLYLCAVTATQTACT
jgi:hypothetical protein